MANEQNLVPFNNKDTATIAKQREIQVSGGKVCSMKKKIAARIRELKKKGVTNESAKLLVDLMEGRECTGVEAFGVALDMRDSIDSVEAKNNYVDMMLKISKHVHGDKREATNLNILNDMSTNSIHIDYNDEQAKVIDNIDKKLSEMSKAQMREIVIDVK